MSQHWLSQRERKRERPGYRLGPRRQEVAAGNLRLKLRSPAFSVQREHVARGKHKRNHQLPKSNNEVTHAFGFQGRGYEGKSESVRPTNRNFPGSRRVTTQERKFHKETSADHFHREYITQKLCSETTVGRQHSDASFIYKPRPS
jgi:hypothetical protein